MGQLLAVFGDLQGQRAAVGTGGRGRQRWISSPAVVFPGLLCTLPRGLCRAGPGPRQRAEPGRALFPSGREEVPWSFPRLAGMGAGLSTSLLLAKTLYPLGRPGHAGPSTKSPGLPRAQPTIALCDPEQVTCTLSLRSLVSKRGTELG